MDDQARDEICLIEAINVLNVFLKRVGCERLKAIGVCKIEFELKPLAKSIEKESNSNSIKLVNHASVSYYSI